MGIEELVERILGDARQGSSKAKEEAAGRRAEILKAADTEAEELYWRTFGALKQQAEDDKRQRIALEALDTRKGTLDEKRRLLEQVFARAREELVALPAERYRDLLVGTLVSAAEDGAGEVILSPADRERFGDEVVAAANRALERVGVAGALRLSEETREMSGGFVLRAKDVEVNGSLDSQIASRREELEEKMVPILFGESTEAEGSRTVYGEWT